MNDMHHTHTMQTKPAHVADAAAAPPRAPACAHPKLVPSPPLLIKLDLLGLLILLGLLGLLAWHNLAQQGDLKPNWPCPHPPQLFLKCDAAVSSWLFLVVLTGLNWACLCKKCKRCEKLKGVPGFPEGLLSARSRYPRRPGNPHIAQNNARLR